jgi:nitrite reductase/ring-hydroxylating ferredoxin subunit/uncharacterized membrane protein
MKLRHQVDRIEHAEGLDPAVSALSRVAGKVLPPSPRVRNLLHGTWLGHPAHPALADAPIGLWLSAAVLDVAGGDRARAAAQRLVGLGLVTAMPAAASGLADWDALGAARGPRRTGVAHAATNSAALVLLALSYAARRAGRHRGGRALGLAGTAVAGVGAYLGGHLAFRQAVGVDKAALEHPAGDGDDAGDWIDVAALAAVPDGRLFRVTAGEAAVMLLRRGDHVLALAATCGHLGGPLDEGDITDRDGRACVVCPWHGSTFDLADGTVVEGPATAPQRSYDVRVAQGRVAVRPRPLPTAEVRLIDLAEDAVRPRTP